MNRYDLLEIGAAGQLYLQAKLGEVLPAEEAPAFEQANPAGDDGKVVFDEKRNAPREDAVVRTLGAWHPKDRGVVSSRRIS